jgi:RsiW-degrading membrane proteinase PrsW (M82 family)
MEPTLNPRALNIKRPKANSWLQVIITGFVFYVISTILLVITQNPNLFPTVVMIGSFLVPVTYVTFFYERRHLSHLSISTTFIGFVYGGILGVLAASLLEPIFVRTTNLSSNLVIGLIEEFAKILGVIVIARRMRHDLEMDGLILGAAAGMGFAALESMGYAFVAFLSSGGSLSQTVFVTLLRGILSPVGHGTWTAIFASVLFREAKDGHFRINVKVIGAFLLVSVLHAAWDGLPTLITDYLGSGLDVFIGQAVVGIAGLSILWLRWREANRLQQVTAATALSESAVPPATDESMSVPVAGAGQSPVSPATSDVEATQPPVAPSGEDKSAD